VGLKDMRLRRCIKTSPGSNRTIVGLKDS